MKNSMISTRHLQSVASLDSSVGTDEIEAGMSLIEE